MPLKEFEITTTKIPTYWVGLLKVKGSYAQDDFEVPLATYEKPVAYTVERGCRATYNHGITTLLEDKGWARAPVLKGQSAQHLNEVVTYITENFNQLKQTANETTKYGQLDKIEPQIVGRHLYLRINMQNGDAAGHNMTTKAAQAIIDEIISKFPELKLIAISGNYCTDKKVSAINSITGRGKKVIAETIITDEDCRRILKTTPQAIQEINNIKNYKGSIIAGSICSANAHYANMLYAIYTATGQDGANIVEGSQGISDAEITEQGDLYFAVTIPNIIVGTVKSNNFGEDQKNNLIRIGCYGSGKPIGTNAKKLAEIITATVLAGELNLLAVLSKNKELVLSHEKIERTQLK